MVQAADVLGGADGTAPGLQASTTLLVAMQRTYSRTVQRSFRNTALPGRNIKRTAEELAELNLA
jgi:hypothetical protein